MGSPLIAGRTFDQVYVDLNPLLHCGARSRSDPLHIINMAISQLRSLLTTVAIPRSRLVITADGPAGLCKLREQRKRRIDNGRMAELKGTFDSQQFSPGCSFMTLFENRLWEAVMHRRLLRSSGVSILLSGASSPGEGELKIFHHVRRTHHPSESRAIVASDSDAYLQSIGHGLPGTHVIRPPWEGRSNYGHFSLDSLLEAWDDPMGARRRDFILLTTLSGNDYIPGLQFAPFKQLWPFYQSVRSGDPSITFLSLDGSLDIGRFHYLLGEYYEKAMPVAEQGLQRALLASVDRETSHARVLHFLRTVRTIANQQVGRPGPSPSLTYSAIVGPSLGEVVMADRDRLIEDLTILDSSIGNLVEPPIFPGTAAILILDLSEERTLNHLPSGLRPIARRYLNHKKTFKTDLEAATWINQQIMAAPLSPTDLEIALPRPERSITI